MICQRRAEKIIPAGVVKQLLDDKVAALEAAESRDIYRRERLRLKDEIITDLLPRALTRITDRYAYIDTHSQLLVVDSASPGKAEELLASLRTTLGRLPATPLQTRQAPRDFMTRWLNGERLPEGFGLGGECELRHPDPEGGVVNCKHQDLSAGEIRQHVKNGKFACRLGLHWRERLSFVLNDDLSIKRLRFEDVVRDAADEVQAEDFASRFDLDFSLMTLELAEFLPQLLQAFGGEEQAEGQAA
jgi:recombination associated protein RdgC